uniref:Alpha-2-glycoprotein 1, zinc n=1 Tax=Jaculus jaculus TaxID=51337 RepID=A0A8C5KSA2_JACJA
MFPIVLSLPLLLGHTVPQEPQAGPYSLVFLYTGLSRPSKGLPRFQATAFLNDQAFFRYDSDGGRAEPVGLWAQIEGMEDWEKESQLQRAREEIFLETLKDIMDYYKDSQGSHTFQGMFGCELGSNRSSGAFWRYAYDGRDFIEFNTEIPAWVPLDPAAKDTKKKWEAERVYVQRAKAYLEEECPRLLRRHLNYSRSHLDRQAPPTVSITSHVVPRRNSTLKCLASDFYPQTISLHWSRAGKVCKSRSGDALPSGNGTYQSWVTVKVPPEDRAPYFCHIEHSGLSQPLAVQWNERQKAKTKVTLGAQPQ